MTAPRTITKWSYITRLFGRKTISEGNMNSKKNLYSVQVCSTEFVTPAYWADNRVPQAILFEYMKNGVRTQGGIEFDFVAAVRLRSERCCTLWNSADVYDTLAEIENSEWKKEIYNDTQELWRNKWEMHHYMIYLDSAGCFEVIAESWNAF